MFDNAPIEGIKGVGPKIAALFKRVGVFTIRELLWYAPFRYIDASQPIGIDRVQLGDEVVISGEIIDVVKKKTPRRHMTIIEATVADENGSIKLIWFNQPYLESILIVGQHNVFVGKAGYDFKDKIKVIQSPMILKKNQIIPIYHETAGLKSSVIWKVIRTVLDQNVNISDPLPEVVVKRFDLLNRLKAIKLIHQPNNQHDILSSRRRLAFDELIRIGLQLRLNRDHKTTDIVIPIDIDRLKIFVKKLPFTLTNDQRIAAWQIVNDLAKPEPMQRLLLGG